MNIGHVLNTIKPFLIGSASGIVATCAVQPIDMVKVHVQLAACGQGGTASQPMAIARGILHNEGITGFYAGISAGILRQFVYAGARLGLYDEFCKRMRKPGEKQLPFWGSAVCSISSGALASMLGNPMDLALVRMQADALLPNSAKRGYKHVGDALVCVVRNEGFTGLSKGMSATMYRAMGMNFGMLTFNAKAKDAMEHWGVESQYLRVFGAAAVGGLAASICSLPFDYVKTQVQRMAPDPATGKMPYKGPVDCALKTIAEGGPQRLWTGFPTFYVRIAPHAMITLMAQDKVKKVWKGMGM